MRWMSEKNLTDAGLNLLAKAELGAQIVYTRIALGDGWMPNGATPETMTGMAHEVVSLEIRKLKLDTPHIATVGSWYTNEELLSDFEFRELGLFATDPDDGEILYAYGNALDKAEYIPSHQSGTLVEKAIDVVTYVGNAATVIAELSSNVWAEVADIQAANGRITELRCHRREARGTIACR